MNVMVSNMKETSADDFTKSFYQLLLEQFGEAPGELMTEGEYRAWCEYEHEDYYE